ncbi:TatD family hydrolase [Zobellia galactanivorans]|uniref:TatD family hydrolase n=1 Tax=Zobellia galactanivorans (strain DSM 12802 / CCUG 47099 / CIP 106680 / NCIMB 13871 / Dsij) TaxID=63186 RepID=UPI0026E26869|nr:TatD family hydrolase [Zobellia galactanivorans]MDO6807266.1 TatD family hydrolase [Zobellia galactanivorans]
MILTDTHTHLYSEAFDEDREAVIEKAMALGVKRFFIPAIDSTYTQAMLELEKSYPQSVFLMMGLHPTHVKESYKEELRHVEEMLAQRKFYAVGEIGIDLYWDKTFIKEQQEAFRTQIQLAKKYKLPIVIHCRDAFDEVFEVLESEKGDGLYGVFHCFTGNLEQAQKAISYNMMLGIGGVVTFKNGKIDTFLAEIPLKNIVLETDSPYLAPVPYRGKRNESAYLMQVVEKLADLYRLPVETVAELTTENSKRVFGV